MTSEERDTRIPYRLGTDQYCKFYGRGEYVHMGDLVAVYQGTCDDDYYMCFGKLSGVRYDHSGLITGVTLATLDGSCGFCTACDGTFHHARLIK